MTVGEFSGVWVAAGVPGGGRAAPPTLNTPHYSGTMGADRVVRLDPSAKTDQQ